MSEISRQGENESSANTALISSAIGRDVAEALAEIGKAALDAAFDEKVLKDVPFFSLLIKIGAIGTGIRDRMFAKKVAVFLLEAGKLPPEKREAFNQRLVAEPDLATRTGETALFLLDKISSAYKARFMGYALRRFIGGDIDEVILNRIYGGLEFLPLWRVFDLPEYYFELGLEALNQDAATAYQSLALVEVYYGDKDKRLHIDFEANESHFVFYHQPFYRPTEIGLRFAELVRDYLAEP